MMPDLKFQMIDGAYEQGSAVPPYCKIFIFIENSHVLAANEYRKKWFMPEVSGYMVILKPINP